LILNQSSSFSSTSLQNARENIFFKNVNDTYFFHSLEFKKNELRWKNEKLDIQFYFQHYNFRLLLNKVSLVFIQTPLNINHHLYVFIFSGRSPPSYFT
jgi:hypothetical protein